MNDNKYTEEKEKSVINTTIDADIKEELYKRIPRRKRGDFISDVLRDKFKKMDAKKQKEEGNV